MGKFLKEYWLWIAAPLILVTVAVIALIVMGGDNSDSAPFVYSLF